MVDLKDIKSIIREYYEQLYKSKFNLEKKWIMFFKELYIYNLLALSAERPMTSQRRQANLVPRS